MREIDLRRDVKLYADGKWHIRGSNPSREVRITILSGRSQVVFVRYVRYFSVKIKDESDVILP